LHQAHITIAVGKLTHLLTLITEGSEQGKIDVVVVFFSNLVHLIEFGICYYGKTDVTFNLVCYSFIRLLVFV